MTPPPCGFRAVFERCLDLYEEFDTLPTNPTRQGWRVIAGVGFVDVRLAHIEWRADFDRVSESAVLRGEYLLYMRLMHRLPIGSRTQRHRYYDADSLRSRIGRAVWENGLYPVERYLGGVPYVRRTAVRMPIRALALAP